MKYNGNYVLNSRPPRTIVLPLPKNRNMLNSHSTSILPQASITTSPKSGLPTHAPIKPPVRKPMPPTAGPAVSSSPPVAFTLVNQAPTPAPALTPNTPKSPALGSNGAPDMQVQASPEACTNQAYPKGQLLAPAYSKRSDSDQRGNVKMLLLIPMDLWFTSGLARILKTRIACEMRTLQLLSNVRLRIAWTLQRRLQLPPGCAECCGPSHNRIRTATQNPRLGLHV